MFGWHWAVRLKPEPREPDTPPMRILVVDDDPTVRQVLSLQLESDGHQVSAAVDGESGLQAVQAQRPDLVVLDVMMPGLSGWDVLERLRSDPGSRRVPVLLLTARDLPDDRRRGYELGASAVLSKSYAPQELSDTVQALGTLAGRG